MEYTKEGQAEGQGMLVRVVKSGKVWQVWREVV